MKRDNSAVLTQTEKVVCRSKEIEETHRKESLTVLTATEKAACSLNETIEIHKESFTGLTATDHDTGSTASVSAMEPGGCQKASTSPGANRKRRSDMDLEDLQPLKEKVLCLIALNYLNTIPPQSKDEHNEFHEYLLKMKVLITGVSVGSLVITVKFDSLKSLEELWKDYSCGLLGKMVQDCFVTEKLLKELNLVELKLKTTMDMEECNACKLHFEKDALRDVLSSEFHPKSSTSESPQKQEELKKWKQKTKIEEREEMKGTPPLTVIPFTGKKLEQLTGKEGNIPHSSLEAGKTEGNEQRESAPGSETVNGVKDDLQDSIGNPPHLNFKLPDLKDLFTSDSCWSDFELPVDILLLTVEDCEFLACLHYIDQPSRRYYKSTGYVYYGSMGHHQEKKLKTALVKCTRGSAVPDGSLIVVNDVIRALGPKVVFSVGTCIGLTPKEIRLGDVVVSSKLTTLAHKTPVSRDIGNLIKHAADGWRTPLKDPQARKVNVKCDGTILSIPPLQASSENIIQKYSEATAVEVEGEGVFAAAHHLKTEWMVVKGIKCYASENQSSSYEWDVFASVMAASVVSNILRNPSVFQHWSHHNEAQPLRLKLEEGKTNTRWNALIKVAVVVGLLAAFISVLLHIGWIGS